jgi:hypothetical protein
MPLRSQAQLFQQWQSRYDSNLGSTSRDFVTAQDGAGNVYVASQTSDNKYITIKYNAVGVQQWATISGNAGKIDSPVAIAVDANGNVYVTGNSVDNTWTQGHESQDMFTLKYNALGVEQWRRVENIPGSYSTNVHDRVGDLAVDAAGNVYLGGYTSTDHVTGYDLFAIKYSTSGVREWLSRYTTYDSDEGMFISLDGSGNVYVAGKGGYSITDFLIVKFNASGMQQWATLYTGSSNVKLITDMETDASGNVYLTGYSAGPAATSTNPIDYITIKYNTSGTQQWLARYDGAAKIDYARDLAIDASGNVYVTGWSEGATTNDDYATVKYSATGAQLWAARYGGVNNGTTYEEAHAVGVDASGHVYVTGSAGILKYTPTGTRIATVANSGWTGRNLSVAGNGNVIVCGMVADAGATTYDFLTTKFSAGSITTGTLSSTSHCVGSAITIPYTTAGTFSTGNVFKAELSNAVGSFATPTALVTVSTTNSSVTARIPNNAAAGTGYRVRIVASNPQIPGTPNAADLTIKVLPTVSLSSNPAPDFTNGPISVCPGTPVAFTASSSVLLTYTWTASDPTFISSTSGSTTTFTATTPGTYFVTVRGSDGTCSRSLSQQVDVLEGCGGRRAVLRIGENADSQLLLYPNPARDSFVLRTATAAEGAVVQLVDMQGRVHRSLTVTGREHRVSVADLPAGLYVVNVIQGASITRKKIQIVR